MYSDTPVGTGYNKGRPDVYDALDDIFSSIGRIASSAITGIVAPVMHATADAAVATKDILSADRTKSGSGALTKVAAGAGASVGFAAKFWKNKAMPFLKKHILARGDFLVDNETLVYFNTGRLSAILDCYNVKYVAANCFAHCEYVEVDFLAKDAGNIILLPNVFTQAKVQRVLFDDTIIFNGETFEDSNAVVMIKGQNCYKKLLHCRENGIRGEYRIFLGNPSLYDSPYEKQLSAIKSCIHDDLILEYIKKYPQSFVIIKMDGSIGEKGILGIVSSYTYSQNKISVEEFKAIFNDYVKSIQTEQPMSNPDMFKYIIHYGFEALPQKDVEENFNSLDENKTADIYVDDVKKGVEPPPPIPYKSLKEVYQSQFEEIYNKIAEKYPPKNAVMKNAVFDLVVPKIASHMDNPYNREEKKWYFFLIGECYKDELERVPEPIKDTVPEPTPDPIPEPTKEPIPEPVKDVIPDPIKEPIPEPIKEPIQEPIPEPASEPIPELTQDPIKETTPEPIKESAPESTFNKINGTNIFSNDTVYRNPDNPVWVTAKTAYIKEKFTIEKSTDRVDLISGVSLCTVGNQLYVYCSETLSLSKMATAQLNKFFELDYSNVSPGQKITKIVSCTPGIIETKNISEDSHSLHIATILSSRGKIIFA